MSLQQLKFFFAALTNAKTEEEVNKIISDSNLLMGEIITAAMPHIIKVTQSFSELTLKCIANNKDALIMIAPTVLAVAKDFKSEYDAFDFKYQDVDIEMQTDVNEVIKTRMSSVAHSIATITNVFKDNELTPEQINETVLATCKAKEQKMDEEIQQMIWDRSVQRAITLCIEHEGDRTCHSPEEYKEAQTLIEEDAKRKDTKRNAEKFLDEADSGMTLN